MCVCVPQQQQQQRALKQHPLSTPLPRCPSAWQSVRERSPSATCQVENLVQLVQLQRTLLTALAIYSFICAYARLVNNSWFICTHSHTHTLMHSHTLITYKSHSLLTMQKKTQIELLPVKTFMNMNQLNTYFMNHQNNLSNVVNILYNNTLSIESCTNFYCNNFKNNHRNDEETFWQWKYLLTTCDDCIIL